MFTRSRCCGSRPPEVSPARIATEMAGRSEHVFSVWNAHQDEADQANSVSLFQVQPHHHVYRDGIRALVHAVLHSGDSPRRQSSDPLQSLRLDVEMLSGIASADHREDNGGRRITISTPVPHNIFGLRWSGDTVVREMRES